MAFTIKLQSPSFDKNGHGDQLALPIINDSLTGTSMATIISLFRGDNAILDFGQLREIIQLVGFLTDGAGASAEGYVSGSAATVVNATQYRDILRRSRTVWPLEDGTAGGANWGNATLPAAEQDSGTTRKKGRTRLIYDKAANLTTGSLSNMFLYGTVLDYRFGPRAAASGRYRIPFTVTFGVGEVKTGES